VSVDVHTALISWFVQRSVVRDHRRVCCIEHNATEVACCRQLQTSGHSNLTKGRIAAAHGRLNRIRLPPLALAATNALVPSGRYATTARFLGPTRVHNPNGTSIGSTFFAGLMTVTDRPTDGPTDRQTDRQTEHATRSVRPHLRTAMRPKRT